MALVIADRVRETTTTTGTGAVTLAGAYTSFQSFLAAVGNGNSTYYTIASAVTGEWEVGIGTYTSASNTLSRTTVLASSNAGSLVSFSSGAKDVFVTQPAERSILVQSAGSGLFSGVAAFTAYGVPYANATTTLTTGSGLTFDGTTFAASNISTAGSVTLSGGTANGVAYLNGSKVVTTGTALTFDGTNLSLIEANGSGAKSILMQGGATAGDYGIISIANGSTIRGRLVANASADEFRFDTAGGASTSYAWYIGSSYSEQMRLTSTGLGIGTSSPAYKLDVSGQGRFAVNGGSAQIRLERTTSNAGASWIGADDTFLFQVFNTGFSQKMGLDINGNLGIGTSSPVSKLHVFKSSGNQLQLQCDDTGTVTIDMGGTTTPAKGGIRFSDNIGSLFLRTNSTTQATIDSSGNLGLGVTPSAWATSFRVLQLANGTSFYANTSVAATYIGSNFYQDGVGPKYATTDYAAQYYQYQGQHVWRTAPSGTAGNAISFTQAMTLDASGNLVIGNTSASYKLDVWGSTSIVGHIRNNTVGTNALAQLQFSTSNNYDGFSKAAIGAICENANTRATALGFYSEGSDGILGERARIDSSGNLGIGTSSPGTKLDVYGAQFDVANTGNIRSIDTGTLGANKGGGVLFGGYYTGTSATSWAAISGLKNNATDGDYGGYLVFKTRANGSPLSEVMRLDSSGNLLVGTTSDSLFADSGGFIVYPTSSGETYIAIKHDSGTATGNSYASFVFSTGIIGSITQSGTTAVLYNTTSDQRLKENIADADSASALIDSLQVRKFDWKSDNSHQRYGFVAQELVTVAPEAVHQPADPEEMMAVDYSKLVPMLVKEIQSLRARVAALES